MSALYPGIKNEKMNLLKIHKTSFTYRR